VDRNCGELVSSIGNPLNGSSSPELALVDPEAARLPLESGETDGRDSNMSAPGTHEMTAGIGLGLEPPLSPPVVSGPGAHAPMPVDVVSDHLAGLPTPPPAIRPPETARLTEEPALPSVHAESAEQPGADVPSIAPVEEELPTMAPPEEETTERPPAAAAPVDYFAKPVDTAEAPIVLEPVRPVDAPELPLIAPPAPEPELAAAVAGPDGGFRLVVRLQDGERVDVGDFKNFGTAMEAAQEVIEQFTTAAPGTWPFYAGRFIRPDLIVSVDLVEGGWADRPI
jgi:hypothetical protein